MSELIRRTRPGSVVPVRVGALEQRCIVCERPTLKLRRDRCGACYKRWFLGKPGPSRRRTVDLELQQLVLAVPKTSATFATRVFGYVDASGDCWEWTGTLDVNGYGVIGRGRRGSGNMPAHRAVFELLVGPIPADMEYDHLCRNHACVNPDHGDIVTPEENKRRGYGRGVLYAKRTRCKDGHPLDGQLGARGGGQRHRYCKTCRRTESNRRYHASRAATGRRS